MTSPSPTRPSFSVAQRRARLIDRHRLAPHRRTDAVDEITDDLVGLHSSDPASVYLSAIARMGNPSIATVAAALHRERSVIRIHAMRRTLWVFTPTVARVAHAACAVDIARKERKQLIDSVVRAGIPEPEQFVRRTTDHVFELLATHGSLSTRRLGQLAPELTVKVPVGAGKWSGEQALHTRLLLVLGFEGAIVRGEPSGSWTSSEYEWSHLDRWLGSSVTGDDVAQARAGLVARYLDRFGPATSADIQWWTGLSGAAVKPALAAIGAEPCSIDIGPGASAGERWVEGWLAAGDHDTPDAEPSVVLLPGLDPTAMGWKEREWHFGPHGAFGGPLFDRNGNAGPTVWVDGRVVGAWAQRSDRSIVWETIDDTVPRSRHTEIGAEAERLASLIGDVKVTPRFPAPLQQRLAR